MYMGLNIITRILHTAVISMYILKLFYDMLVYMTCVLGVPRIHGNGQV